jgi:hypothetical protein
MSKADIQDAFRLIPIHPTEYHLLGFQWDGQFYLKLSNGGCLKDPLILPFRISLLMFCTTTSGFFLALLWLFGNF